MIQMRYVCCVLLVAALGSMESFAGVRFRQGSTTKVIHSTFR